MRLTLSPRNTLRFLTAIVIFFVVMHVLVQFTPLGRFLPNHQFALGHEINLQTWFASTILLFCAILAALIACIKNEDTIRFTRHWWGLAFLFAFLSADESAQLHEALNEKLGAVIYTPSFPLWVIPYAGLVLLVLVSYLRFLKELPATTRRLFVAAAVTYVAGAIGVEVIQSLVAIAAPSHVAHHLTVICEEILEMMGVILFIKALLSYMSTSLHDFDVLISPETAAGQE